MRGSERKKEERKRNLGLKQNIQIMLRCTTCTTKVGIIMSHAVLKIMLHAAGPLVGFVRPGHSL